MKDEKQATSLHSFAIFAALCSNRNLEQKVAKGAKTPLRPVIDRGTSQVFTSSPRLYSFAILASFWCVRRSLVVLVS